MEVDASVVVFAYGWKYTWLFDKRGDRDTHVGPHSGAHVSMQLMKGVEQM